MPNRPPAPRRPAASARPGSPPGQGIPIRRKVAKKQETHKSTHTSISLRAIALVLICMMAFVLVFPRLQAYLAQRQQIAQLKAQFAETSETVNQLRGELARWQDPDWIARQARMRLSFVFPGETGYRVVDPEHVADALAGGQVDRALAPSVLVGITKAPWYNAMWDSVKAADAVPLPVKPLPAIPPTGSSNSPSPQKTP